VRERRHDVEKIYLKRIRALREVENVSKPEIVSSENQYFTWTIPVFKEAKFVRRINAQLRTTNMRLKTLKYS